MLLIIWMSLLLSLYIIIYPLSTVLVFQYIINTNSATMIASPTLSVF